MLPVKTSFCKNGTFVKCGPLSAPFSSPNISGQTEKVIVLLLWFRRVLGRNRFLPAIGHNGVGFANNRRQLNRMNE